MPKGYYTPFTEDQENKIKKEFLLKPVKQLARETGCTFGRIMRFLAANNLEIPKEVIQKRKNDSLRKKGHVPFNKGLNQTDYMTPEAIEKTKKTRFKKGVVPLNTKKDGCIVGRADSKGRVYQYIRISKNNWQLLHRNIWEKVNGPIPSDCVLIFIDGDTSNVSIDNLKLITKIENMYRNSNYSYPEEIIPVMVLNRKLENKLTQLKNGTK